MITLQKQYKVAIYCRLSVDDGNIGESGSIMTQKNLLTNYCNEHHFHIAGCYCDDGWSGTNFERPEFKRMIADIDKSGAPRPRAGGNVPRRTRSIRLHKRPNRPASSFG